MRGAPRLVADYLLNLWGQPAKIESGLWVFVCPFCTDHSGHFRVKFCSWGAVAHCVRCGYPPRDSGKDLLALLAELRGVERKVLAKEILGKLAQEADDVDIGDIFGACAAPKEDDPTDVEDVEDVEIENVRRASPKKEKKSAFREWNRKFFDILDPYTMLGMKAQKYLFQRNFPHELVTRYHLRYAHRGHGEGCKVWSEKEGRKYPPLQTRMHGRIMIPVTMEGEIVYYQGRTFINNELRYRNPTKGIDTALGAGECLFGWDDAVGKREVILCEGPFDAMKIGPGALAQMGHGMTPKRIELIKMTGAKRLIIFFDKNLPKHEQIALYNYISPHIKTLWTISRTDKKDAGEMEPAEIRSTIKAAKEMGVLRSLGIDEPDED